jgi:hypothetical protein
MPDGLTWKVLVEAFGPSGVLLGLGVITLWKTLPWLQAYLVAQQTAMERIANATERMLPILRRIEDQSDAMTKDIIGIFAALDRRQPSTTARHQSQARRQQDHTP